MTVNHRRGRILLLYFFVDIITCLLRYFSSTRKLFFNKTFPPFYLYLDERKIYIIYFKSFHIIWHMRRSACLIVVLITNFSKNFSSTNNNDTVSRMSLHWISFCNCVIIVEKQKINAVHLMYYDEKLYEQNCVCVFFLQPSTRLHET